MNAGTIQNIRGNSPVEGGAVHVNNGTFTMNSGSITSNYGNRGGGVFIRNGTFNMRGGGIGGNSAMVGGGVFISQNGNFTKTGGTIVGDPDNTAISGNRVHTADVRDGILVYNGHAVAVEGVWKLKNTTSGPEDHLSWNGSTFSGIWCY